ncbi:hypothetical protein LAZ67_20001791 [Cordylochernes scorpioides]|uniref:DNA helicase Pif1-like 2B domain-containing protein n=1 Tax=Cordylochernes scorpioides TaxID=51811 RepID=A0ABY6LN76_9ARAC|nr:hypothetical protein LAZ67_20001791 [Cordylochernes scorpioides]
MVEGVLPWQGGRSWADLVLEEVCGSSISVVGEYFFGITVQRLAKKGLRISSDFFSVLKFTSQNLVGKVGTIVMLLRNFNLKQGLYNGTCMVIQCMCSHVLEVQILTGANVGHTVLVSKHLWLLQISTFPSF